MTVGDLRKAIANLTDDVTVVVVGGEWDFQEAQTAESMVIEWHDGALILHFFEVTV